MNRQSPDDALDRYPDPTVGKPFHAQKTVAGFERQSHLPIYDGRPLVVRFGRPAK